MNESIFTGCPNEVGNDIEPFIKKCIKAGIIKFCPWSLYPLMSNMSLILITKECIQEKLGQ